MRLLRFVLLALVTLSSSAHAQSPMLAKGQAVDWWFVFKFNAKSFPNCSGNAQRACLFGGSVQQYKAFSQQFVYASSKFPKLQQGSGCAGGSVSDPIGATFDEVFNGSLNYVLWNDQFYGDPAIKAPGCSSGPKGQCQSPWGHSKGMLAWNKVGDGLLMQVSTPSWPASGSKDHPRKQTSGNTLGCVHTNNNVLVSQHFFSLRLNKADVAKVLKALKHASVATGHSAQIFSNGGPAEIQALANDLGLRSDDATVTKDELSSGVILIAKSSKLNVPPWQMVSAVLGGVPLRTATWWAKPYIPTTTPSTKIGCWDKSLGKPGTVEVATSGHWNGTNFGLKGGPTSDFNHAKFGVATSGDPYAIFGDLNQQGSVSTRCDASQNGRGGMFFVVNNKDLNASIADLLQGDTASTKAPK